VQYLEWTAYGGEAAEKLWRHGRLVARRASATPGANQKHVILKSAMATVARDGGGRCTSYGFFLNDARGM
jgi:hypothetical protein